MAHFQLFVQELGKAPRIVPLAGTMVVGREQCRIGIADGGVFVEGIGQTNRTHVDGKALDAGQRVTVAAGGTIRIGRTVLELRSGDATTAPAADLLDATMVARGPARQAPAEQERTADFVAPSRAGSAPETTSGSPRPGIPAADFGQTIDVRAAYRPGSAPPPTDGGEDLGQTMNVPSFRPGRLPEPAGPKAGEPDVDAGRTIDLRPAARPAGPPPAPAAPEPATPPSPPPRQAPPAAAASMSPAPPPASAAAPNRPKTVIVPPPPAPAAAATHPLPMGAAELEARLHQAVPRLFVKGDALRRRVRLMKVKSRVGRAETADVLLPNESVSELHAEIEFDGAQWSVRDCGSTNGTLVDGAILRSASQRIGRNTLLGFGSLRGLFLCNDPTRAAEDRRLEQRALRRLVAMGLVSRDVAAQVQDAVQRDGTQTIAEILLGDTQLQPTDWVTALQAARSHRSLWDRLRGWFRRPGPRAP